MPLPPATSPIQARPPVLVLVIAKSAQADEDTARDVIHRFIALAA
ncbi:hypothetical protein [Actinoallomurus acanthiterrae]